jgi:hypothetical protein
MLGPTMSWLGLKAPSTRFCASSEGAEVCAGDALTCRLANRKTTVKCKETVDAYTYVGGRTYDLKGSQLSITAAFTVITVVGRCITFQ